MATILQAINRTRGTVLCARVEKAQGLWEQSRGLLGRDGLEPGSGMLFEVGPLNPFMWMHMFFMRFPIDIVFMNRYGRVIRINRELKPWRVSSVVFGARSAIEIAAGNAVSSNTEVGDQIDFVAA